MTTALTTTIAGYRPGTYTLDPAHSEIGFSVRHMVVSKVRGKFTDFSGSLTAPENVLDASLTATINAASIDTGVEGRDGHLKSADFFDVEQYPTITFVSTGVVADGDDFALTGDMTIKDVTKPVTFQVEFNGFIDAGQAYLGSASATAKISRSEFGLTWNALIETGGAVVGDEITIQLELEAALDA